MYDHPATDPTDLSKVEILGRATRRITEHVAMHGINATALSLFSLYERMYNDAPGPEGILVQANGEWAVMAA